MYRMMSVDDGADSTIWQLNQAKARVPRQEAALGGEDEVQGGQRETSVGYSLCAADELQRIRGDVDERATIATTTTTTTTHLMSKHDPNPGLVSNSRLPPSSCSIHPKLYSPSFRCHNQIILLKPLLLTYNKIFDYDNYISAYITIHSTCLSRSQHVIPTRVLVSTFYAVVPSPSTRSTPHTRCPAPL